MTELIMQDIEGELESLEEEIEAKKEAIAKNEGSEETLKDQLNELDISSMEEAKKAIAKELNNANIIEGKIVKNFDRLKKNYEW